MKSLNSLKTLMLNNERESVPNTVFLAFNQASLRLRHLTQIIGCNLSGLNDCASLYTNPLPSYLRHPEIKNGYYFTLETNAEDRVDYTSNLQPSTSPNWEPFDCKAIFPVHLLSLKGIIVRVWLRENEKEKEISSWGVNFSGLVPLSTKFPPPYDYAPNTLLFKLRGRYYTAFDCILRSSNCQDDHLFTLHQGCLLALSETKPSYSVPSLCRMHGSKREIRKEEKKKEEMHQFLECKGFKTESKVHTFEKEIENMRIKVCLLMEQLEVEMNKLRSIKSETDNQDCLNQDKGIELLDGYQNLNKLLISLKTQEAKLIEDNEILQNNTSQVKDRRCQLLSQLHLIFPLDQNKKDNIKYSICKVPLPDAESQEWSTDPSLSVSLGFASQLFVKIAFLVNIPLKYPLTLRGSLSSIADLTSTQLLDVEPQFPLYTRGKEREKLHFNYGVFLLNKNIAQLRWNCGLPTSNLRSTLYNIWHLLRSLYDTSFPTQAIMPDTTVSSLVFPESLRQVVQTPVSLLHHQTPRLPLNPLNPKVFQSLPDTPSSPRNRPRKRGSLEDDSFLCTASDTDVKTENHPSDDAQSECEGKSPTATNHVSSLCTRKKEMQQNFDNVTKLKQTSCSLDQGINFIKNDIKENDIIRTVSLNSSLSDSARKVSSGSLPSIAKNDKEDNNELPLSPYHEQTTELLKSWSENYPSPYHHSIAPKSNSSEMLENWNTQTEIVENNVGKNLNKLLDQFSNAESQKLNSEIDNEIENRNQKSMQNNHININSSQEFSETKTNNRVEKIENKLSSELDESVQASECLVKELGISLDDLKRLDHSFLEDVAKRTAHLASQNCSFKFSLAKSSEGDD